MSKNKVVGIVTELAEPVARELGFELVDVEYVKEAASWYLRLYIDKPEGISLDDCTAMNDKMDQILDDADPIPQAYIFEVCSPGLDRPLKTDRDFEKYRGEMVEVNLYEPLNGSKYYEGELIGRENGTVKIKANNEEISFSQDKIAIIKRLIQF